MFGFDEAIKHLKEGKRLQRTGWNGKNQYIVLANITGFQCNGLKSFKPHENIGNQFILFVGTSGYQVGWLASQSDMLANDWKIVEG